MRDCLGSSNTPRSWMRSVPIGVIVSLSLFAVPALPTYGDGQQKPDAGQEIIDRIRRDWADRSSRVKTLTVRATGTDLIKMGSFKDDPDAAPGYAGLPCDHFSRTSEEFLVDYSRSLFRRTTSMPYMDLTATPPAVRQLNAVWAFDGKHVFFHERSVDKRTKKEPELTIASSTDPFYGSLDVNYDPVAWSVGNVTTMVGTTRVTQLRSNLQLLDLRYLHETVVDGRTAHRIRVGRNDLSFMLFDVDVERGSLILRGWSVDLGSNCTPTDIRLKYTYANNMWCLKKWTSTTSDGRVRSLVVTDFVVNAPIPAKVFHIDAQPGMMVSDLVRRSYYQVGKNGERIPYSRTSGKPIGK